LRIALTYSPGGARFDAYSESIEGGIRDIWPEELKDIAEAFEAARERLGLSDRTDPATTMLAKLTIDLAKQGQFTAASLRDRILKEMKPKERLN